ncbi:MAG: polysaccharide pyruvyl transferase CsaB [Armatimonadetes bacterium]|nr:polysaccharide pyruvyl transferase CsaB [Armatimonadota bacterium]
MKPRLLFSGYYGLGNAGDEAVLAGLLQGMREAGIDAEVTVLSADPAHTEAWHGVRAVPRMKPDLLRALSECDVLVSGGGSLLQDVTSSASLAYYLTVIALAKLAGKRVVIAAQGMGPVVRPASRRWTGIVLNRADLITVRDAASAALLRDCGVTQPVHVTADPAFLLRPRSNDPGPKSNVQSPTSRGQGREAPVQDLERGDTATHPGDVGPSTPDLGPRTPDPGPQVGLALRAWKDRNAAAWGADLCRELRDRGASPFLIPMHEPHDRDLAEAIRAAVGDEVAVSPPPNALSDVLDGISGCDVLLGMRLHALLLAANAGLPVVAWSYDPKVDALMHQVGRPHGLLPLSPTPAQAADAVLVAAAQPMDFTFIEMQRRHARRTLELISDLLAQTG